MRVLKFLLFCVPFAKTSLVPGTYGHSGHHSSYTSEHPSAYTTPKPPTYEPRKSYDQGNSYSPQASYGHHGHRSYVESSESSSSSSSSSSSEQVGFYQDNFYHTHTIQGAQCHHLMIISQEHNRLSTRFVEIAS